MNHIDDVAELYALGELMPAERAAVDAHASKCPTCLRKLGEAEETILALEREHVAVAPSGFIASGLQLERRAPSRWWLVVAAAFALGLLPSVPSLLQRGAQSQNNLAAIAMLHSHFNHAQFSGADAAPAAKVLYARDKSWIFVMVEGSERYDVYAVNGTVATRIGQVAPQGSTSNLYLTNPGVLDRIELRDGSTLVESAKVR